MKDEETGQGWSEYLDDEAVARLRSSVSEIYNNAGSLLTEAQILRREQRYNRALALVLTADEELGKAFMLLSVIQARHWTDQHCRLLTEHSAKHGLVKALRIFFNWIEEANKFHIQYNRSQLVSIPLLRNPPQDVVDRMAEEFRRALKKKEVDRLRQRLLYARIDRNGKFVRPAKVSETEFDAKFDEAIKLQTMLLPVVQQNGAKKSGGWQT